jgi:hypothetical protein
MKLNPSAVELARELLDDGQFRISTPWSKVQPSAESAAIHREAAGAESAARWYLAVDPDTGEMRLPIGDFKALHRSGLVAALDEARLHGWADIAEAADDILFLFDRLTAC